MEHRYRAVRRCLEEPPDDLWVAPGENVPVMRASLPAGIEIYHEVDIEMGAFYELTEPIKMCGRDVVIHAHGHERLYPRFTGTLEAYPTRRVTQLELAGTYEIPTGAPGVMVDTILLGHLAEATLADLFGVVMSRVSQCAGVAEV